MKISRTLPAILASLLVHVITNVSLVGQEPETPPVQVEYTEATEEWQDLFDGKTLDGWAATRFGGEGAVAIKDGMIRMSGGVNLTGITCTRDDLPNVDYEIEVVARRTSGLDFFAAITFPFKESHCSFIPGGWAGTVTGLSNIDDLDASSNDTSCFVNFDDDRWYTFRIRVESNRIGCWVDNEQVIDRKIEDEEIDIRPEMTPAKPLGIAAWESESWIRNVRVRRLKTESASEEKTQGESSHSANEP